MQGNSASGWRWVQIATIIGMGVNPAIMGANGDGILALALFTIVQGLFFWLFTRSDVPHIPTGMQIFFSMCMASFVSLLGYGIGSLFA